MAPYQPDRVLRRGPGVPAGGEFAGRPREEPAVSLRPDSDEHYNAEGTYEFPVRPRTARQHLAFWSNVRIPDSALVQFTQSYDQAWSAWYGKRVDEWVHANPPPLVPLFGGRRYRARKAEWDALREEKLAELGQERTCVILPVQARPLLRAAQMARHAAWLSETERDKLLSTDLGLWPGRPSTVRDVVARYQFADLPDAAYQDPATLTAANLDTMRASLEAVSAQLEGLSDQVEQATGVPPTWRA